MRLQERGQADKRGLVFGVLRCETPPGVERGLLAGFGRRLGLLPKRLAEGFPITGLRGVVAGESGADRDGFVVLAGLDQSLGERFAHLVAIGRQGGHFAQGVERLRLLAEFAQHAAQQQQRADILGIGGGPAVVVGSQPAEVVVPTENLLDARAQFTV